MKNSIYFFKELNRKNMQENNLNKQQSIQDQSKCSIHAHTYEYFCSDCECLACEECRCSGPHHEETHKLIHLEQIIGLTYSNQAHFCAKDLIYIKKMINKLFSESGRLMHHLKGEGVQIHQQTVE